MRFLCEPDILMKTKHFEDKIEWIILSQFSQKN